MRHKKLNEPLDVLISHVCMERLSDIADAIAAADRQTLQQAMEGAYQEIRDDLGQYAAPKWLAPIRSSSALVHAICVRIGEIMRHMANADEETSGILRDATTRTVSCLCLAMSDDEEAQLDRTLSAMRDHARAAEGIAGRLSECPALAGSSRHLRQALEACVMDRIGELASVLISGDGEATSGIASWILRACPPSAVQRGDLPLLGLDGRRDRRGIDLASAIVHLCMKATAHALETAVPEEMREISTRMAAAAFMSEPVLEIRFRARLLAVGRTEDGDGR